MRREEREEINSIGCRMSERISRDIRMLQRVSLKIIHKMKKRERLLEV